MNRTHPTILIIGGVAAGTAAAAKAKRLMPSAKIILFEQGEYISYGTCSLPYYISGVVPDYRSLIHFTADTFEKQKGCIVKIRHCVEEIRPHRKCIVVRDLLANSVTEYKYDRLLITTGADARFLNPDWKHLKNVFTLKSLPDAIAIRRYIEEEHPRRALIIGGGFIGMEMAEAFHRQHLQVTVVEKESLPMPGFEEPVRQRILEELKRHAIAFIGGTLVSDLSQNQGKALAAITPVCSIQTDMILLALGFKPNSELARIAHIRCGSSGGILVDRYLKTSADHVFAAGACAEYKNFQTNRYFFHPLGNLANKTGRIAGINLTGGHEELPSVLKTLAVKIFDLEVAAVGMSAREAESLGYHVRVESLVAPSRAQSFPGSQPLLISLIIEERTQRLLGANLTGTDGAALRANILATAITAGMTLKQIASLDLIYTPPVAPVRDPLLLAASQASKES